MAELIAETPGAGRLGRHVNHDPRSRGFPAETATALKSVQHTHYGPVLDQGNVGSCTGHAIAQCLNTVPFKWSPNWLHTHADALAMYERATQIDPFPGQYPPTDTGSDGLDVCKAAVEKRYIRAYTHTFSLDDALHALVLAPVITGVNWYEGFDRPDANGHVSIAGNVRGGHEFCVVGLDTQGQTVTAINSWGSSWGKGGFFIFTWNDWGTLLSQSGDVTVPQR